MESEMPSADGAESTGNLIFVNSEIRYKSPESWFTELQKRLLGSNYEKNA
jgi:hypothetical protein